MNFFEQELRRIIEPIYAKATYVGRFCFIPLGEHNRAKISFVTSGIADNYDTLQLKIINKNDGEIDCSRIKLNDVLGQNKSGNSHLGHRGPHIWQDGLEAEWYGYRPTEKDYTDLSTIVKSYVELFEEPVQDTAMGMQQSM